LVSSRVNQSSFKILTDKDGGFVVRIDDHLGRYSNKPEAEKEISEWFLESFGQLEKLINSINQ
jgi:hypothetical protein